jgi:adenylate cyclase
VMELLGHFSEGLSRYRAAQWDLAQKSFKTALSLNPADALSATYIERCEMLKSTPPTDQWDGVWIMSDK